MTSRSTLLGCLAVFVGSCSSEEASGPSSGSSSGGSSSASSSSSSGGVDGGGSSSSSSSSGGPDGGGPKPPLYGFVGATGKITVFTVDDATGAWTLKKETAVGGSASFLAFDPARRRVVATNEDGGGQIRSFTFDPATGALTPVNAQPAGGAGTTHVSLDPTGKWAFAANYTGGTMGVFPIDAAGTLGAAKASRSPGGMAHWIGTDPAGTRLFCVSLGANVVAQYTLDTTTGQLTDNGTASPPANAGPRHLAFHPNEKWAYVINESAITVTPFDYDKATGKLVAKPATISALPPNTNKNGVSGAEIVVHPSGKAVYASTRGYNAIARFTVGADGTLTLAQNAMTGANRPRSFGIDPDGTLLFAGNQDANEVVGFKIDAAGVLTPMGKIVDIAGPTFVGLARIP